MSFGYNLFLAEARPVVALARGIVAAVAPARARDPLEYRRDFVSTVAVDHLWIHVGPVGQPSAGWLVEDLLGFLPRTEVSMVLDKEASIEADQQMLAVTDAVLSAVTGDAALAWETDHVVLWRRGGVIELEREQESLWSVPELREQARRLWGV